MVPGEISIKKHVFPPQKASLFGDPGFERSDLCFLGNELLET